MRTRQYETTEMLEPKKKKKKKQKNSKTPLGPTKDRVWNLTNL